MCDEEIGSSQVQAKVPDRLLHYFAAVRMRHPRIDYEIPAAIENHIRIHGSDFRDWYLNGNFENTRGNFANYFITHFGLT